MIAGMIKELLDQVTALHGQLKARSTVNVNDRGTKANAIALASAYFSTYRVRIIEAIGENGALRAHDEKWQDLVRLAQDRKSTRLNSSHSRASRMPSSA